MNFKQITHAEAREIFFGSIYTSGLYMKRSTDCDCPEPVTTARPPSAVDFHTDFSGYSFFVEKEPAVVTKRMFSVSYEESVGPIRCRLPRHFVLPESFTPGSCIEVTVREVPEL